MYARLLTGVHLSLEIRFVVNTISLREVTLRTFLSLRILIFLLLFSLFLRKLKRNHKARIQGQNSSPRYNR